MSKTTARANEFLNVLESTIKLNPIVIDDVLISDSRDGSTGYRPYEGPYWGKNNSWYSFKVKVVIPAEYEGKHVKCNLRVGREEAWNALNPQFLVKVNGHVTQALDTNHKDIDLTANAAAGDAFDIELEAYTGREYSNSAKFSDRPLQFRMSMYVYSKESETLYYDLKAAKMAAEIFPKTDYNTITIENYLTSTVNLLDCRIVGSPEYFASIEKATKYIEEEFYGKVCRDNGIYADIIGHTHIDVAWLWTVAQTRAKAVRSFSTEIELMKEYPEHIFSSSQPQLYKFVKEDCPEIYEQIKERVAEGRWEVEGAMWLEADCNITSGESLIRQIIYGKRFMKEEFGVDSKVLWLPDVFGYSAALPQILNKTGVTSFVTSKIHWNDTNHFPYDTFMWKGIDGSEIFSQYITAGESARLGDGNNYSTYNARIYPLPIAKGWEIYQQKDINNEILVSFGYGDGGGGVTREMLEMNRRMKFGLPGVPTTRLQRISTTLDNIKRNVEGKKLPKWFGELYLEFHRGTYTSQAKNKNYNRRCEFLLATSEAAQFTNKHLLGGAYDKSALNRDWENVLLNQFHDIIPGSSIHEVYEVTDAEYTNIIKENTERLTNTLQCIADQTGKKGIFVYNPTGIKASGIVKFGDKKYFVKDVPAWGYTVIDENCDANENSELTATASHMENKFFSIDFDEKGLITSIYDKLNKREVITKGQKANALEAFDDHPYANDNWELSNYHKEIEWNIDDLTSVEVVDVSGTSVSVKQVRKFLNSEFVQTITIYRDIPRVDFDTTVDWHEHHIFVKTAFPVDIMSDKATYEIQYGAVERPAHTNTSWDKARFEVCAHKFADYGEADYGVALLNNNKYGYDIHDGVMRLSLIKCGTYPDPDADQGIHKFSYSLMPHAETWREAEVANEAYMFNNPMIALPSAGNGKLPEVYSLACASKSNIFITVAKEAENGESFIVRAYETQGKRTDTAFNIGFDISSVAEVDMLEQEVFANIEASNNSFEVSFKPFEIKTFKIC